MGTRRDWSGVPPKSQLLRIRVNNLVPPTFGTHWDRECWQTLDFPHHPPVIDATIMENGGIGSPNFLPRPYPFECIGDCLVLFNFTAVTEPPVYIIFLCCLLLA